MSLKDQRIRARSSNANTALHEILSLALEAVRQSGGTTMTTHRLRRVIEMPCARCGDFVIVADRTLGGVMVRIEERGSRLLTVHIDGTEGRQLKRRAHVYKWRRGEWEARFVDAVARPTPPEGLDVYKEIPKPNLFSNVPAEA
jgi:hypothetical protein